MTAALHRHDEFSVQHLQPNADIVCTAIRDNITIEECVQCHRTQEVRPTPGLLHHYVVCAACHPLPS